MFGKQGDEKFITIEDLNCFEIIEEDSIIKSEHSID